MGAPHDPPLPHRPRNQWTGSAQLRIGSGRLWAELDFEDDVTRTTTGRLSTPGATQIDVGVAVELRRLPFLSFAPPGLELSTEWINATDKSRVDSLGMPLPGRLWYLRLRGHAAREPENER